MVVAGQLSVRNSVGTILLFFVELPDDEGLITGSGDQHGVVFVVLLRESGDDGGDPVAVSVQGSLGNEI